MKVYELLYKISGIKQELRFFNQKFIYDYSKEYENEYLELDKYYHDLLNSELNDIEKKVN